MPRPRKVRRNWDELATIWTVSDELWAVIQPSLRELDPPKPDSNWRSIGPPMTNMALAELMRPRSSSGVVSWP